MEKNRQEETYQVEFTKLNDEPIEIEYVPKDDSDELEPSFMFEGERHWLQDFVRTHNNPWLGDDSDYPDYIHAVDIVNYYNKMAIELVDGRGDEVNVYRMDEKKLEKEKPRTVEVEQKPRFNSKSSLKKDGR